MRWYAAENMPKTHARPTFSESWFHQNYGFAFGERYYADPIFRTEQDQAARRVLSERFGALGLGSRDPAPQPHLDICGHRFIPALLDCPIIYQEGEAPAVRHQPCRSPSDLASLPWPNLSANHWAQEFLRQGKILLERYGRVDATINYGGPLNAATSVVGSEFFVHLADMAPEANAFLDMVADLCLECFDRLTLPLNPQLGSGRELFIGNCPVAMLSPKMYRESVLPADLRLRRNVARLGLHHCGKMDGYLGAFKELLPLDFIEVGWGSTVRAVRENFPDTILDMMINVYDVSEMSAASLEDVLTDMVKQGSPRWLIRDIWMADIGPDVPYQVVENFVEAVNKGFESAS